MKKIIAKKTIILFVLKALYKGSSINHPITQTNIVKALESNNVYVNRRTISRNIQYLINFGLPIARKPGRNGGYYYDKELDNFFN